ncbi:MAG: M20/M25/M40 family metallo-hydrolase [Planctomycetes bacterium]|nr:M20/M25/M40 family metallo-hydrolase [Planctomycetota bacterium]
MPENNEVVAKAIDNANLDLQEWLDRLAAIVENQGVSQPRYHDTAWRDHPELVKLDPAGNYDPDRIETTTQYKVLEKSAQDVAKLLRNSGCFPHVEVVRLSRKEIADIEFPGQDLANVDPKVKYQAFVHWPSAIAYTDFDPNKPTLFFYNHHDVQPPGKIEKWVDPRSKEKLDPFKLVESGGRLYARGSADDKGGFICCLAAIEAMKKAGDLPINAIMFVDGEEEAGSKYLEPLIDKVADNQLKHFVESGSIKAIVIADTGNFKNGIPSITTTLRGVSSLEVSVSSIKKDCHSGMFGGSIVDPAIFLSRLIADLADDDGTPKLKEIFEGILPLDETSQRSLDSLQTEENRKFWADSVGAWNDRVVSDEFLERTWYRPSVTITDVAIGNLASPTNAVRESASARISIRVAPGQDPERILNFVENWICARVPETLKVQISNKGAGRPFRADGKDPIFQKVFAAFSKAFEREAVFIGAGGSIPFVETITNKLKRPAILFGIGDENSNAHSELESFCKWEFQKCIESMIYFCYKL